MERTMTVEEKIKRAEEIYARRHELDAKNNTTVYLQGNNNKKDFKIFKKLILQIVVCLLIYLIFYTVKNNNYIFTEDFVQKTKEVLSYDTNFEELYNNVVNWFTNIFQNKEETNNNNEENIGGSSEENSNNVEEKTKENEQLNEQQKEQTNEQQNTIDTSTLTEEEQKILQIKNTTTFIKPVEGVVSSAYGLRNPTTSTVPKNHTGTDIAANLGTKIISSTDGEVVEASSEGDYGKHLKIKIGDVSIIYAHCNDLYVNVGDKVAQGQEIAEVGSTGNSTGPHLHFEIRLNEETIDPQKILEL